MIRDWRTGAMRPPCCLGSARMAISCCCRAWFCCWSDCCSLVAWAGCCCCCCCCCWGASFCWVSCWFCLRPPWPCWGASSISLSEDWSASALWVWGLVLLIRGLGGRGVGLLLGGSWLVLGSELRRRFSGHVLLSYYSDI